MKLERAIEIVKYTVYTKPVPTDAERREATRIVLNHPEVWDQIMWGHKA